MKKQLLPFIFALFSIIGWSQKSSQNDYSISINGNRIATTANFKQQVDELKKNVNKQNRKTEYTLLQFTKIPTLDEQKELKNQGVTLISYLSNNAYYVAIDSKYYNQSTVSKNIRTVVAIDSKFKIDPTITSGAIPDYAGNQQSVKVVVSYFKGVDKASISGDLTQFGVKEFKNMESFFQVYLTTSTEKLNEIAKLNWVQNIELIAPPVESDNLPGITSHKVNILSSKIPGLGYDLSGKGVKIGIWDGNLEKHIDHTGRVINREYESPSSHGEHVSGTIGGAGILDPKAKGMAPEVQIYGWNFNTQSNGLPVYVERELAAVNDGVELTSNSYGSLLSTGYNTIRYSVSDRGDDDVTVKYPYLLNVYSNGNAQAAYAGGFYTSTKASKNALHVAANDPNDVISSYSSFGPTVDGRLVPQISAVGTNVYSLDYNNSYQIMSGTSMATPGTSGTVALLYERYKNIYGMKPLASLMKALVANTAKDNGNPGPDYKYGFGNLNALRAIKVLDKKMFYSAAVANGASYEKEIVVPAGLVSLKVMMAYSDIGATPGVSNVLVNDLDIKIVRNGTTTLPWILDASVPNANATRGVDNLNNIEQITLDNPVAGTYKIIVSGTTVPLNAQEFSVVYDYVAPELVLTYPIGGEKFNPDTTEYIRWDYEGAEKTFNIEFSNDGGNTYTTVATNVPSAARNFAWKVPAGVVPNAKIRISAGSKVEASFENFAIMSEPTNLVITPASCGVSVYKMDWDEIPGAKYEVLKLNGYKFDLVATVTDPTYTFTDLTVGENNWFTVRAIDIESGLISERAKAINVEPISKAVLTTLSLPFKENFNDRKPTNYTLSKASSTGSIGFESQSLALLDAVKMSGSAVAGSPLWVASTTTTAFTNNPKYIKRLSFCDIDASSLTGKAIRLKFNLIWSNSTAANKNFFRVLVNGAPATSGDNVTVYGGTTTSGNTVLTYNLAAVAGGNISITFEGVMDNDATTTPTYNTIFVDNVEIYEATTNDLALTAFTPNVGVTASETVSAKIYNFSPVAISNIPISYKINNGTEVEEMVPGPIAPLSETTYNFTQKADFSVGGVYTVVGKIMPTDDTNATNNSLTRTVRNTGTDVLMGSTTTVTTCSAVFTDSGSRYADYTNSANQTITFKPAITGNSVKVDFTEFAVEEGWDYLYVYNGPLATSPLLGRYDGNALPPSLTSTATGGELTFKFTSDTEVVDKGWVATISCVAKPTVNVNDAAIASIVAPEFLGKKTATNAITIRVTNLGSAARTNVPVFYQVNGQTKVSEVVPTIASLATESFTFLATADLSVADATYTITAGIDEVDDVTSNNTLEKVVYNKNDLPTHTNTNGYAITSLKWDGMINNSGTTAYSDFKNIKIPVYAGFTYQPQVTISKPERPISRDLSTTTPGVFTMIVIDLNGDGNLTDEFYAGTFWVNTLATATAPAIASSPSTHNFRNNFSLVGGLTIPSTTIAGEKLMRVIHMFRSPSEYFNVNLGPTFDGLTSSRDDFEVEEYTIVVGAAGQNDAGISAITPIRPYRTAMSTIAATIKNNGNVPMSNFNVAYTVNGGSEVVQNYAGSIAVGATANITFATLADLRASGTTYNIDVYTKLNGDVNSSNDKLSVVVNTPEPTTNVFGNFVGGSNAAIASATPNVNLIKDYTVELWVNLSDPATYGHIFNKTNVWLWYNTTYGTNFYGENAIILSANTSAGAITWAVPNAVKKGTWQHLALTVSSTNVYTLYIDGVPQTWTKISGATAGSTTANATSPMCIGNRPTDLIRSMNGYVDEFRVWNTSLSQVDISDNMTRNYPANTANMLAYYKFIERNGSYLYDYSSNDNTALITNADTNGLGAGKFWNTPVLLQKLELKDQLSSSYDAATKTYTILLNDGVDITAAVPVFTAVMNSVAKINTVPQVSGVTATDFTLPVTFTVEGIGFNTGITETYTVKVLSGLSAESSLLSYEFVPASNPGLVQKITTAIAGDNASATVSYGIDVSKLKASFSVSPGAELFIDDVKQASVTNEVDYSNSVLVTVVAENKLSSTNYMVTVNAKNTEAKLVAYSVANQVGVATINENLKTVKVMVNNNANLNALVPSFQVSDNATTRIGTYVQNSGVTSLNYLVPVEYNVMSQSGLFQNYVVSVERVKPVLTLLDNAVITVPQRCEYTEPGYTATDNLNKNITSSVVVSGVVSANVVGQYILTYTVTDDLNNVTIVTRTVNVVADTTAPVVRTKNITVQLDASSNVSIVAADINNGSTDNCGITLVELDKTTFNCANVGVNTVTLKVTDKSGNVSYGTASVTVVNSEPNLIRKHFDDVIFFDNSSNNFKAYSWYKNGILVPGQTGQYFKDSAALNGTYYVVATKVNGTLFTSCPLIFSPSIEQEFLKIAPNPVNTNAVFQLITNVESAKLQNARVTVFNVLGNLISDTVISKSGVDIVAPGVEGIYIVKMTLASGKYFTKNLLVKN